MARRQLGAAATRVDDAITRADLPGPPFFPAHVRIGEYIQTGANTAAASRQNNLRMTVDRMYVPAGTYDQFSWGIWDAGSAGATVTPVLYADDEGRPGALVLSTAAVPATSSGDMGATISLTLTKPTMFFGGLLTGGAPATLPNLMTSEFAHPYYTGPRATAYPVQRGWALDNQSTPPASSASWFRLERPVRWGLRRSA